MPIFEGNIVKQCQIVKCHIRFQSCVRSNLAKASINQRPQRPMAQRQGGRGGLHGGSNFADIYDVAEYQPDILRPLQPKVTSQDVFILFSWCACLLYSTDLGYLIGNIQCGNFRISLPLRFCVKSICVIFEPQKLPF